MSVLDFKFNKERVILLMMEFRLCSQRGIKVVNFCLRSFKRAAQEIQGDGISVQIRTTLTTILRLIL